MRAPSLLAAAALAAAMLAPGAAVGLTSREINWCSARGSPTAEQKIAGCTAMIASGRYQGKTLAQIFNNRGNFRDEKGDLDLAISDFDQAIRLDPTLAPAFFSRGLAYQKKGNAERAIADYSESIRLKPNNPAALNNRGFLRMKKGDLDGAIADLNQAVKLDPNDAIAWYVLAEAYCAQGNMIVAVSSLAEAIQRNPAYARAGLEGCGTEKNKGQAAGNAAAPDALPPFGADVTATMEQDGTIELTWSQGPFGTGPKDVLRYPPTHPLYRQIKGSIENSFLGSNPFDPKLAKTGPFEPGQVHKVTWTLEKPQ